MASLRKAINDMCAQCIYDPKGAGPEVVQIELCTSYDCALWPVRRCRNAAQREEYGYSRHVRDFYGLTDARVANLVENPHKRPNRASTAEKSPS